MHHGGCSGKTVRCTVPQVSLERTDGQLADPGVASPSTLSGVYPVLQTPWTMADTIDVAGVAAEVEWILVNRCDGVVLGMVSEYLRLTDAEFEQLTHVVCEAGRGAGTVISVGCESTVQSLQRCEFAASSGATALMAMPPIATVLGEDALVQHFRAIIRSTALPVVVQDASGYVGQPLPLSLLRRLQDEFSTQVLFKPEAPPIGPRVSALRHVTEGSARILEGTGGLALVDSYRRGIVGTMPGAEMCWAISLLWESLRAGRDSDIYAIQGPLLGILTLESSLDAFLAIEKYLLVKQGVLQNDSVRGPVGYELDEETRAEVDRLFERLTAACDAISERSRPSAVLGTGVSR